MENWRTGDKISQSVSPTFTPHKKVIAASNLPMTFLSLPLPTAHAQKRIYTTQSFKELFYSMFLNVNFG
jgi:hypothetical protein